MISSIAEFFLFNIINHDIREFFFMTLEQSFRKLFLCTKKIYRSSKDNIRSDIGTRDFQHIFFNNEMISPELFNIGLNGTALFYLSHLMDL